ncbi:MAG: hypothetical protein ACPGID_12585 [Rubricella sp.]
MLLLALIAGPAFADPATIVDAQARPGPSGWTFSVTIAHGDTGWDDYADGWRVLAPDGTVLGTRVLHHPHVEEQPFTRSLSGLAIPDSLDHVEIEASESLGGWGGERLRLALPR